MTRLPDLTDPRYLDEIGWFLYHERFERDRFGGSYADERRAYSRLLLDEVRAHLGPEAARLPGMRVVTVGCGCTADLSAWPVAGKIAVDPLLQAYQKLGLLLADEPGTTDTVWLSVPVESLPLLDESADLVVCRNALDHMPQPGAALDEMWRVLKPTGFLFLSVDTGGSPTPDEPTVFSGDSLRALLDVRFHPVRITEQQRPHSRHRHDSLRVLAKPKPGARDHLDRDAVLRTYRDRCAAMGSHDE